jgi:UDP-glucose 4-epimerase
MKYALITGGLGLIGSNIARQLIEENLVDKVICLDHFGRYVSTVRDGFVDYRALRIKNIEESIIIERGDSKYYSIVHKLLAKYQPEYIFHLAALPLAKLDNLNAEEAMEGSVETTVSFLECISELNNATGYMPKRFVYASSSMVYGDFQSDVATEEHPTKPKEIYGTMKLSGEVITKGLGGFYKIPYAIIRPSAVYGPTDMNRRVSHIFMEKAFKGEPLKINGIDESLDFTFVKDIANGFVLAAIKEKAIGETFNITYGQAHTLLEYAQELQKYFPDLEYEITPRDEFRPKRGTLSIEKAKKLLEYTPKYSLERGVKEYHDFLVENKIY